MEFDLSNDDNHWAFCESMGRSLIAGGATIEDALKVLIVLYNRFKKDYTEDELRERLWKHHISFNCRDTLAGIGNNHRNVQQEAEDWIDLQGSGVFSLNDIYRELSLIKKEEKTAGRVAITRLCTKGKVEKEVKGKTGTYRIVNKDIELIDIYSASTEEFDVKLPLGVNDYVKIHPGCVIMVAGESNSGKTAFCLNIARLNKYHPVNYLSSEMQNGTELKIRLQEFNVPLEVWKDVRFVFRTDSFPDVIQPDAINIVDYLDEGSDGEAYKMVGRIRDISNKVKNGIVVIAIQKHSGKSFGFGGEGTLNRARLYMSITRQGILKIEKGKIWKHHNINPNGMQMKFKLVAGCRFIKDGDWMQ